MKKAFLGLPNSMNFITNICFQHRRKYLILKWNFPDNQYFNQTDYTLVSRRSVVPFGDLKLTTFMDHTMLWFEPRFA